MSGQPGRLLWAQQPRSGQLPATVAIVGRNGAWRRLTGLSLELGHADKSNLDGLSVLDGDHNAGARNELVSQRDSDEWAERTVRFVQAVQALKARQCGGPRERGVI